MKRLLWTTVFLATAAYAAGEYFDVLGTSSLLMGQNPAPGNAVPVPFALAEALAKGRVSPEQQEILLTVAATNGCVERALRENMPDPKKHSYKQKERIVRCGLEKIFHCAQQIFVLSRLRKLNEGDAQDKKGTQQELLLLLTQLAKPTSCTGEGENVSNALVGVVKNADTD
jgi:hypothetical protein